jgi:hypothetical protein
MCELPRVCDDAVRHASARRRGDPRALGAPAAAPGSGPASGGPLCPAPQQDRRSRSRSAEGEWWAYAECITTADKCYTRCRCRMAIMVTSANRVARRRTATPIGASSAGPGSRRAWRFPGYRRRSRCSPRFPTSLQLRKRLPLGNYDRIQLSDLGAHLPGRGSQAVRARALDS